MGDPKSCRLCQHGERRSWETIRKVLSTHQRLIIEYNERRSTGVQRHHIRLCSKAEDEHKAIDKALGMSFIPLGRKYYPKKE